MLLKPLRIQSKRKRAEKIKKQFSRKHWSIERNFFIKCTSRFDNFCVLFFSLPTFLFSYIHRVMAEVHQMRRNTFMSWKERRIREKWKIHWGIVVCASSQQKKRKKKWWPKGKLHLMNDFIFQLSIWSIVNDHFGKCFFFFVVRSTCNECSLD